MEETVNDVFLLLQSKIENWVDTFITMLPNLVVAVLLIVLFYFLARFSRNILQRALFRVTKNEAIINLAGSIIFLVIVTAGFFIALGILNLDKTVTSLLAGVGIIGLALGFAFRDIAANFLSGFYIAIKSPINVGDMIQYNESYGTVKEIGLRATRLKTLQGQDIVIPNRLIIENRYTHFTVNKERRIDLDVGISYGDDLEKAEKVTLEAINKIDSIKKDKPVDLYYLAFGNSSINFVVRYWVDFYKETDYLFALSQGIKNIKKAYIEHGITITFPIRTLDFGIKGGKTLADMLKETRLIQDQKGDND
ncbi:MAG: mechanosensitive ion channel family protein [Bacteroidota bacterium]